MQFLKGATIVCSSGGRGKLYNLASKEKIRALEGHEAVVRGVASCHQKNGQKTLVSIGDDATVRIWNADPNASDDRELQVIPSHGDHGHKELIRGVDISKDGSRIISGSKDCTVKIWACHANNWEHENDFKFGVAVYSVLFAPDGQSFFAGGKKGKLRQYECKSLEKAGKKFVGHGHIVNSLAVAQNKDRFMRLVSASSDNTVIVWDIANGEPLKTLKGHTDGVISVDVSPDGTNILSGSHDRTAKLWNMEAGTLTHTFEGHSSKIMSVAFHPSEEYIVTSSYDKSWKLWSLKDNTPLYTSFDEKAGGVNAVIFSPDGNQLICGFDDKHIDIRDLTPLYNLTTKFFKQSFEHERKVDEEGKDFDWNNSETRTALKICKRRDDQRNAIESIANCSLHSLQRRRGSSSQTTTPI